MRNQKFGRIIKAGIVLCLVSWYGISFAGAPILAPGAKTLTQIPAGSTTHTGDSVGSIISGLVTDGYKLDDFEHPAINNVMYSYWGGQWQTINDNPNGGASVISPYPLTAPSAGGHTGNCIAIKTTLHKGLLGYNPFVGVVVLMNADQTKTGDLTKATGFRYWYKGGNHIFKLETSDIDPGAAFQIALPASAVWKQAVFTWDSLKQPGSAAAISAATKTLVKKFTWIIQNVDGYSDSLWIDDIEVPGFTDRGIAVTDADNSNGNWQYSTNSGANWTNFGNLTDNTATLLNTAARVRFLPNPAYTGTTGFFFRAWNQSDLKPSPSTGVNVSINGGITAYSTVKDTARVTVLTTGAPGIGTQPQAATVNEGQPFSFSVRGVTGNRPLTLTWKKDGQTVGTNDSTYSKPAAVSTDAGTYWVEVQNSIATTASQHVLLTVRTKPRIILQPQTQSISLNNPVTFTVQDSGTAPLYHQWQKDGIDVQGANAHPIPSPR